MEGWLMRCGVQMVYRFSMRGKEYGFKLVAGLMVHL